MTNLSSNELPLDGDQTGKSHDPLWIPNWLRHTEDTFVGRHEYLAEIESKLLDGPRLVLLYGQAGSGKTRLALQVAARMERYFGARIFGIPFDRLSRRDPERVTPEQMARNIVEALWSPAELAENADVASLAKYLNGRLTDLPVLLILDNFERVNNSATRTLLSDLLTHVPQLRCLVTCRPYFSPVSDGYAMEVGGMHCPHTAGDPLEQVETKYFETKKTAIEEAEGYQLFRDRALACDPTCDLSDQASLVSILAAVEGNALGIELAAAQVGMPLMRLEKIAEGLWESRHRWQQAEQDAEGITATGAGSGCHESLAACIDQVYRLLPTAEQTLYLRLGLLPADFTVATAQMIAGVREELLVNWSRFRLLSVAGERCHLPPALREFAVSRLPATEAAALTDRFVAHVLGLVRQNHVMGQLEHSDALRAEMGNLHAVAALLGASAHSRTDADHLVWFGLALQRVPFGARSENIRQAIECYENALNIYSERECPAEWATTQNNLGTAYSDLPDSDRSQNLLWAIECFTAALKVYTEQAFPLERATTQNNLGTSYYELSGGDRNQNLERAIECFTAALGAYTEQDHPLEWATTHNNLGAAWYQLSGGDRSQNLERAIECFTAALKVYTEQDHPLEWEGTQHNLGLAYYELPGGDRSENLLRAIHCFEAALRVRTERDCPLEWAATQLNLGNAYAHLTGGDQQNLKRTIQCYKAALRVRTERNHPLEWAATQNNLGAAYSNLPTGDRSENLLNAIRCFKAILRVRTKQDFPLEWAMTQNNLGIAHSDLPNGDRGQNLGTAIQYFGAALNIYTEKDTPREWARVQNNLGNAYRHLPTGDRGQNLGRAIQCYTAALRVRTEKDYPREWAMTRNNLGNAYSDLPTGDRGQNLGRAIQCYEAALRVRTERDFPLDWAMTQNSLGLAWASLPGGDWGQNLRSAIQCFEATLKIYTEAALPREWASAQNNLGNAYSNLSDGDRIQNLRMAVQCYEAALRVLTEKDYPRYRSLIFPNLQRAQAALAMAIKERARPWWRRKRR